MAKMKKKSKTEKRNATPQEAPVLNTRLFWVIIAGLTAADIAGVYIEGLSVTPGPLWDMCWRIGALLLLSFFYTRYRPDARIATLMQAIAMFAATATPVSIFYYLATAWHQPLIDAHLAAADQALGLDWVAIYKWLASVPALQKILSMAYYSLLPQSIVLIIALNFAGKIERCWELPWLCLISSVLIIPFSLFWPAVGAFGYYHVNESEQYVQIFMGLYNGTLKTLDFQAMQGIVQFPSFHAASAILLIYAARGVRYVFPFYVALNVLMFIATPPMGGHYFADVWGGIVLAGVTIMIVRKYGSALLAPKAFPLPETLAKPA